MNATYIATRRYFPAPTVFWKGLALLAVLLGIVPLALADPPANDNLSQAAVVSSSMLTNGISGSNVDATREPGEPTSVAWASNPRSSLGNRSVW